MTHQNKIVRLLRSSCAAAIVALATIGTASAGTPTFGSGAMPAGDGTMSDAAHQSRISGALPTSEADVAAKAAADAAATAAFANRSAENGDDTISRATRAPVIAKGIAGQSGVSGSPPDTFGATGPTRYIQTVNSFVAFYTRAGNVPINIDTLNELAGAAPTVNSFDPQIIWDPTTNRFYYAMDSIFSATDNRITLGFSKTASPNSSADFCHYNVAYNSVFPDYPKLGDNQFYMLIGTNNFAPNYIGSDVIAVPKPAGTAPIVTCPTVTQLVGTPSRFRVFQNIKDPSNAPVLTPTPANSIDAAGNGFVVGRNAALPSTRLWIGTVTGTAAVAPTLSVFRFVTVLSYSIPSSARQPVFTQVLDTLDARTWQAVLAKNPLRNNLLSLWTNQTVANGATASKIQWYEIRPNTIPPTVLRQGTIAGSATTYIFNGAISSDRRATNATTGGKFVIGYNVSSPTVAARIQAASSVSNVAPLVHVLVKAGAGPYRDFTCAGAGQKCRWGDYASADPDPAPQGGAVSAVGLTHQFSKGGAMPTTGPNWTTWIYHIRP